MMKMRGLAMAKPPAFDPMINSNITPIGCPPGTVRENLKKPYLLNTRAYQQAVSQHLEE
jgi:hypothetical protein